MHPPAPFDNAINPLLRAPVLIASLEIPAFRDLQSSETRALGSHSFDGRPIANSARPAENPGLSRFPALSRQCTRLLASARARRAIVSPGFDEHFELSRRLAERD